MSADNKPSDNGADEQTMTIPLHPTNNLTLQFFLIDEPEIGICEVGPRPLGDSEGMYQLVCTCPDWTPDEETCDHCVYVANRILTTEDRSYPLKVSMPIQNTGLALAVRNPHLMRHWMLHHAKVVIT